jgi:hypothetical protein
VYNVQGSIPIGASPMSTLVAVVVSMLFLPQLPDRG